MLRLIQKTFFRNPLSKLSFLILLYLLYYFGLFSYVFQLDYNSSFSYPLYRNIVSCAEELEITGSSTCPLINEYRYQFVINPDKCSSVDDTIRLVILVKSAVSHQTRRDAIRDTWGYEKRFSDTTVKVVFILGMTDNVASTRAILSEQAMWHDIVQADFLDTYYNNTIKTMMAYKWATKHCGRARFYMFVDDDMYVSVKNVLRFVRNPTEYPAYVERGDVMRYDLPVGVKLVAGSVQSGTSPHRHMCSKWYVSLAEYAYDQWPPYVSAGSYVVSNRALIALYYGSFFTKHFRYDDIYVGILARKMNMELFDSEYFHVLRKKEYDAAGYRYTISSHGYGDADELGKVWREQKRLGNA